MSEAAELVDRGWSADGGIGCGVRSGIRSLACVGHPRCRERATYVLGPGRCERPDGRRSSSSERGCAMSSRQVRSNLADRIWGGKKIFWCVTTRGRNVRVLNGFGRGFGLLAALLLGLGMLGFGAVVLAAFGLAASGLPAVDLPQAFRILAVALVPAPGLVLASASFAQADAWARSPWSGPTFVFWCRLGGAHGRCFLPGESSGRMRQHSLRALSKIEADTFPPV